MKVIPSTPAYARFHYHFIFLLSFSLLLYTWRIYCYFHPYDSCFAGRLGGSICWRWFNLFSSSFSCISWYLFKILNVAHDVIRLSLIRHSSSFAHWPRLVKNSEGSNITYVLSFHSLHLHQHFVLQLECCEQICFLF